MKYIYTLKEQISKLTLLILLFILGVGFNALQAQTIKPFIQRTSQYSPNKKIYNIKGDFQMIGNTNLTLVGYSEPQNLNTPNSNNNMEFVDVDSDPNTINSSSAELKFYEDPNVDPDCSRIVYAGLYWTGRAEENVNDRSMHVIYGGTSENQENGDVIEEYQLSIVSNNSPTPTNGNDDRTATYTFTPQNGGDVVVFTFRTWRNNGWKGEAKVSIGGAPATIIPGKTSFGGFFSNRGEITFNTPQEINNGAKVIHINSLRKKRNTNMVDNGFYANVTHGGSILCKRKVKLRHQTATNYTEFTANINDILYPTNDEQDNMYAAYVEVTDYVRAHGMGDYTVADIALREGNGGSVGYFGGWGMIVVYENDDMPWRDVTIFDGYAYVQDESNSNDMTEYEFPISGFKTVQNGAVQLKYGIIAGEGDKDLGSNAKDRFSIDKYTSGDDWVDLFVSGSNTVDNFFNSSLYTGGNARNPNYENTTGIDIKMDYIPNTNNEIITNNQESTRFKYSTNQDTYMIFCIAMAVDAYIPEAVAENQLVAVNEGAPGVDPKPGETIKYTLEIKNKGTEAIENYRVDLPLPFTTDYNSASATYHSSVTATPTPDITYDAISNSIIWEVGTLPYAGLGNTSGIDVNTVLATLTFSLDVTKDCFLLSNPNCSPTVQIMGVTRGKGATSQNEFEDVSIIYGYTDPPCEQPIKDAPITNIDAIDYVNTTCTNTLEYETRHLDFCNVVSPTISFTEVAAYFPIGSHFYDYIDESSAEPTATSTEYTVSTDFPATLGTINYYAIPPGYTGCFWKFDITVDDITSTPIVEDVDYCLGDATVVLTATPTQSDYILYWYETETGTTAQPSITPDASTVGVTEYWVAEGKSGGCISPNKAKLTVTVYDLPIATETELKECDDDTDGFVQFTLTDADTDVLNGQTGMTITYHESLGDAESGTNSLTTSYTNTVNPQTIYARVENNTTHCYNTVAVILTVNAKPEAIITGVEPITCATPTITLDASGSTGSETLSYLWNDGSTNSTLEVTNAGIYTLTVTDGNGCTDVTSVTVEAHTDKPEANIASAAPITCATPTITLDASGSTGSGTLSYLWNDNSTNATLDVTNAGIYTLTVTDGNGCTDVTSVTVEAHTDKPEANITGAESITCATPTITLDASGSTGSETLSYLWNDGSTNSTLEVTNAGIYTLTVTDGNGCTDVTSVTIEEYTAKPTANITGTAPITCTTPTITLDASGSTGSGTLSYKWNDNSTNATLDVTSAGIYTLTVTDGNGCTDVTSVTVEAHTDKPVANITGSAPITCATPTITLDASGSTGSGTLSYLWNDNSTNATLDVTSAGTYTVTVADVNGCTDVTSVTIEEHTAKPEANIAGAVPITCATPTITLDASGSTGLGTLSYLWNDGSSNSTLEVTNSGIYTLTVTDGNGCTDETSVMIEEYTDLPTATVTYDDSPYCAIGTATPIIDGAIGGVFTSTAGLVLNTNTGEIDLAASVSGTYTVTYTFSNSYNCTNTAETVVVINALPETPVVNVDCTEGVGSGIIEITNPTGAGYEYALDGGVFTTSTTFDNMDNGDYVITVRNAQGCEVSETVNVDCNCTKYPEVTLSSDEGYTCATTSITVEGNTFTNATTVSLTHNGAGTVLPSVITTSPFDFTYIPAVGDIGNVVTITLTTDNPLGLPCDADTKTYALNVHVLPAATIFYDGSPYCAEGTVTPTISGILGGIFSSTEGLDLDTNNGEINLGASTAGTYTVTYTFSDDYCTNTTETTVTIYDLPTATVIYDDPYCAEGTATPLILGAIGGSFTSTAGLVLDTNTGEIDLEGSIAGTYTVIYTFSNGNCTNTTEVSVTIYDSPTATVTYDSPYCAEGIATPNIVGAMGGSFTSTVGLVLDANTGEIDLEGSIADTYTVTYTFSNGNCTNTTESVVIIKPLPTVDSVGSVAYCNGTPDCSAIEFTGDLASTTYSWESNLDVGFGLSGTGNITPFTVTNNTGETVTAVIIVTPELDGCEGKAISFTVTVYPTPKVNQLPSLVYEHGDIAAPITFTSSKATITYEWESTVDVGFGLSGTGDIDTFTATNNTGEIVTTVVTVTPKSSDGCDGDPMSFTITVKPAPTDCTYWIGNCDICGCFDTTTGEPFELNVSVGTNGSVYCPEDNSGTWSVVAMPAGLTATPTFTDIYNYNTTFYAPIPGDYILRYTWGALYNNQYLEARYRIVEKPIISIHGDEVVNICKTNEYTLSDDREYNTESLTYSWSIEGGTISGSTTGESVEVQWNNQAGTATLTASAWYSDYDVCSRTVEFTVEKKNPTFAGQVKYWNQEETYMPSPYQTCDYCTNPHDYFYVTLLHNENRGFIELDTQKVQPRLTEDLMELMSYFEFDIDVAQYGCDAEFALRIWDGGLVYHDNLPAGQPTNTHLGANYTYKHFGSVNATDALAIQLMVGGANNINAAPYNYNWVGLNTDTPQYGFYSHSIADVNSSNPYANGGITALDALTVKYRSVGLIANYPDNGSDNEFSPNYRVAGRMVPELPYTTFPEPFDWDNEDDIDFRHSGAEYEYMSPATAHYYESQPFAWNSRDYSFINIYYNLVGDINSSYTPEGNISKRDSDVELAYEEAVSAQVGEEVTLPIRINHTEKLGAITLSMTYRNDLIEVLSTNYDKANGEYHIDTENGLLNIAWYDSYGKTFANDEAIAYITVKVLQPISENTELFSLTSTTEFADVNAHKLEGIKLSTYNLNNSAMPESSTFSSMNYPNPFKQHTTIAYTLPESGEVNIAVYDLTGRLVKHLISEVQTAGTHTIEYNVPSNLNSGVLIYKITLNGKDSVRTITNKMSVSKSFTGNL